MFDFLGMVGNYEQRVVDNHTCDDYIVDTAAVNDSAQPYETGIKATEYNNGDWIIVELYDTKSEAIAGHSKWVEAMKEGPPDTLKDVSSCTISSMLHEFDDTDDPKTWEHKRVVV